MPAQRVTRNSKGYRFRLLRFTPPIWPHWPSPMRVWCPRSSIWLAESACPETLQLHLVQTAQRAAEGKVEITLGVQLFQRHLGLDVQRHTAVVALVDQGDEAAYRIVIVRQRRQLPIPGIDPLGTVLGASGDTPLTLLAAQARHFGEQNGGKTPAQFDEIGCGQ